MSPRAPRVIAVAPALLRRLPLPKPNDDASKDERGRVLGAAARFNAVIVLKGATSWIATPDGALYRYQGGNVGLATSGSGDTLAGIVAGLSARGAPPVNAVAWGVYLHGSAGRARARRMGELGFLARELLAEIPPLLRRRT